MNGISAPYKRDPPGSPTPSPHKDIARRQQYISQEMNLPPPDANLLAPWSWTPSLQSLEESLQVSVLWSCLVCGILLQRLQQAETRGRIKDMARCLLVYQFINSLHGKAFSQVVKMVLESLISLIFYWFQYYHHRLLSKLSSIFTFLSNFFQWSN